MIFFPFRVNKSFLEQTNHPITIPRENNAQLIEDIYEGSGGKTVPVHIISPTGRILDGEIYFGVSGYGPYYQIKVMGNYPSVYFGNLNIGETIGVGIKRNGEKITIEIFSPDKLRKAIDKLIEPTNKYILRKNH